MLSVFVVSGKTPNIIMFFKKAMGYGFLDLKYFPQSYNFVSKDRKSSGARIASSLCLRVPQGIGEASQ